jgi:hypothetical protein
MHYLVCTMNYKIYYSGYLALLEGYIDANWASDMDELYVMSGYVFTFGGAAVSWMLYKQTILMMSSMEAELAALDTTTIEVNLLHELLMDLPIVEKPLQAILMSRDNQTIIVKVDSLKDNMKSSRHIKRRLKSIRRIGNSGVITLDYIHTKKNLTDPFTKGLSRNVIDATYKEMGLRPT